MPETRDSDVGHTALFHVWDRGIGFEIHRGPQPDNCYRCSPIVGFRETFEEADARLIVTAVNNHAALVEALRALKDATPTPLHNSTQVAAFESAVAVLDAVDSQERTASA